MVVKPSRVRNFVTSLSGSHNGFLHDQAKALHKLLRPYRRLQLRGNGRVAASFDEPQAIVDALTAGDGEAAAAAESTHSGSGRTLG
jgi:DNA-binding FadR family transcriptional regulator